MDDRKIYLRAGVHRARLFALKLGRNKLLRSFAFFGALGWLAMAGKIAVAKAPILFG